MITRKHSAIAAVALMLNNAALAIAGNDWDKRLLFDPSPAQLEREHAGQVHIYDGMLSSDVDRAMDQQFDRVGSMMFVRTLHPAQDGDYEEDDDCD